MNFATFKYKTTLMLSVLGVLYCFVLYGAWRIFGSYKEWWFFSILLLAVSGWILKRLIAGEQEHQFALEKKKNYNTVLSSISEKIIRIEDRERLCESLCDVLVEIAGFDVAWIGLIDESNAKIVPYVGSNVRLQQLQPMDFDMKLDAKHVVEIQKKAYYEKSNIIVSDLDTESPMICHNIPRDQYKALGAFPLFDGQRVVCILSLYSQHQKYFDAEMIQLLGYVLSSVSCALKNIKEKLIRSTLEDELRIASYAFESQEAMTITDSDARIIRINKAFTEVTGYQENEVLGKNPSILKSSKHDRYFYQSMWDMLKREGRWKGEIFNKRKSGEVYPELLSIAAIQNNRGETTHYIAHFFDITHIKDAQREAEYKAEHDSLTGLMNRSKLLKEAEVVFSEGKYVNIQHAFIFIDLDNFKQINDFYGHSTGDSILIQIASRLKVFLDDTVLVGRFGGDEFAMILLNLAPSEEDAAYQAEQIVKQVQTAMQEPMVVNTQSFVITCSIGINLFPDHEKTIQDVVAHADIAMYHAKKSGRNQYAFFDNALNKRSKQLRVLEKEIREALIQEQFVLHYQPKVDIDTSKIVGVEALIRWNHPERGMLYPDDFLGVAHETRQIDEIEKFVINESCRQLGEWLQKDQNLHLPISINITPRQFQKKEFASYLHASIDRYNVDASFLELELLEDTLLEDMEGAIEKMKKLKALGIKFAIDDFGKGYSSMTYLQKLPVDTIKIDKTFVMDIANVSHQEIIKMIINFAKIFNLKVLAEGVENHSTLLFLKQHQCDMYQGYYYSKAVKSTRIAELLEEEK